jgi:hypothetical protein
MLLFRSFIKLTYSLLTLVELIEEDAERLPDLVEPDINVEISSTLLFGLEVVIVDVEEIVVLDLFGWFAP